MTEKVQDGQEVAVGQPVANVVVEPETNPNPNVDGKIIDPFRPPAGMEGFQTDPFTLQPRKPDFIAPENDADGKPWKPKDIRA